MSREQIIAHLALHGWEPYGGNAVVHQDHGTVGRYSDASEFWSDNRWRSVGYDWGDLSDVVLGAVFNRIESKNK